MRCRTLSVKIHDVQTEKRWAQSRLTIMEYGDTSGPAKKVFIRIEDPSDLTYIRTALDEIENYWRERLGVK